MRNRNRIGVNDVIAELSDEDNDLLDTDGVFYESSKRQERSGRQGRRRQSVPICMRRKEQKLKDKQNWTTIDGGRSLSKEV